MRLLMITFLGRFFFHLLVLLILLVYRRLRVLVEVVFGLIMVRNPGLSVSLVTSLGRVVPARDGFIMHSSNWSSRHWFMVVRIVHRRIILVLRLPPVLIIFIVVVRVGNHGLQVKSPHRHNWLISLPHVFQPVLGASDILIGVHSGQHERCCEYHFLRSPRHQES